jgi:hypothetical protein
VVSRLSVELVVETSRTQVGRRSKSIQGQKKRIPKEKSRPIAARPAPVRRYPGGVIRCVLSDVSKVPKPDSCNATKRILFDHIVGADEKIRRDFETEALGGSQIDDEVELRRLYDW